MVKFSVNGLSGTLESGFRVFSLTAYSDTRFGRAEVARISARCGIDEENRNCSTTTINTCDSFAHVGFQSGVVQRLSQMRQNRRCSVGCALQNTEYSPDARFGHLTSAELRVNSTAGREYVFETPNI